VRMLVNVLSVDIDRQLAFYATLFGFAEIERSRSPIYRALDTGGSELGFNAPAARELLSLPPAAAAPAVDVFATFMLEAPEAVDSAAARAAEIGGRVVKPPFRTYYGQWQAVLADPEGHVFRVASLTLPPGA
jgi:predicted enzyme related to lactoylglutathione lyase